MDQDTRRNIPCKFFSSPSGCSNTRCPFLHTPNKSPDMRNSFLREQRPNDGRPKSGNSPKMDNKFNQRKGRSNKTFTVDDKINPLAGLLGLGKTINSLQLRIYSTVSVAYQSGKFVAQPKKDEAFCSISYKEAERTKPVTFYFKNDERNATAVQSILKLIVKSGEYVVINMIEKPYALFYHGHVQVCFETIDELIYSCLENGNLKLIKKNYTDPSEKYKVRAIINDNPFQSIYLWQNTRVELKSLHIDKNPGVELNTVCVICLENEASYAIIPCGHKCLCAQCRQLSTCPLCRAAVKDTMKIY